MDTESDLITADRDFLIAIIAQPQATVLEQQRVIERLERRVTELGGQAKPDGPPRMPGLKAKSGRQPPAQQGPRKQRRHGFARPRMTPTHRVEHVVESCPDCGAHLSGGWTQRTREVIELPVVPVQVTEHVFIARTCSVCRRRRVPTAQLDGVALGRQRLGVNLISRIATLREEGRLPIRSIQWYLRTVHQLRLSVGAIVSAIHQHGAAGPTSGGWNGGPHPRQPSGPRRRNRLASEWEQRLRVRALDQSLSALLPSATSCGGVGARRWWTRRWASHSPEYWSAIATPPTTITMAPSNGAGRTCCGTSTTWWLATSKLPRTGYGELFVFVAEPDVPSDNNPGRAQPASSGHQPQGQRRHPLGAGHRAQDDAGIHLRHLARPRFKTSRRLPSAAHFPPSLNCYVFEAVQLELPQS